MSRPTPAQDRLLRLLRSRGEVRRAEALRVVSGGTVDRAVRSGRAVRIRRGRAVWLAAAQPCLPLRPAGARRPAVEGVPGGRIDALSRLLAGAGRRPAERAADFFMGR